MLKIKHEINKFHKIFSNFQNILIKISLLFWLTILWIMYWSLSQYTYNHNKGFTTTLIILIGWTLFYEYTYNHNKGFTNTLIILIGWTLFYKYTYNHNKGFTTTLIILISWTLSKLFNIESFTFVHSSEMEDNSARS